MARGWESKSVEQQQDEARQAAEPRPRLTPQEASVQQKKDGLGLARKRVLEQLRTAQNPNHRKVLENALADLEARLALLP